MQCKLYLSSYFYLKNLYFLVSSELMQQRQRVGDLEEEVDLLQKQLRATQRKVIEKVRKKNDLL
jgi:hypothetical protein